VELSNDAVLKIEQALSIPRLSKYENFYKDKGEPYEKSDVLMLYERNLIISNKFFYLLNYFEVVLRNAVVQAIEISFRCNETNSWHENEAFIRSLSRRGRYTPKSMFDSAKEKFPDSPSKMIPELKFVFWQKMLMANYEERIWQGCFNSIFPNATVENRQIFTYDWTDQLRELRNRIAHHEPIIFNRNLENDLEVLTKFIYCRCINTYDFIEQSALDLKEYLDF
jgi:hypothetical protein